MTSSGSRDWLRQEVSAMRHSASGNASTDVMQWYVSGCVTWVSGCVGEWVCECVGVWVGECVGVWVGECAPRRCARTMDGWRCVPLSRSALWADYLEAGQEACFTAAIAIDRSRDGRSGLVGVWVCGCAPRRCAHTMDARRCAHTGIPGNALCVA